MTTTDNYEQEINRIREELHEEAKGYTQQEWIDKVNREASELLAQYGLKLAA
ncbi:MAG: hypothetical protein FWC27_08550 [Firmicutes bacterium]|nr:hypothetical protein [Bacillota bacterium]